MTYRNDALLLAASTRTHTVALSESNWRDADGVLRISLNKVVLSIRDQTPIGDTSNARSNQKNMLQAYEELENEMQIHFGKRKYSDYATFRVTLSRETKKKNNPTKP